MTIYAIIANADATFSRIAGFAQKAIGIDAGHGFMSALTKKLLGAVWSKHLPTRVRHSRVRLCTRGLTGAQSWSYSMGAYSSERSGRRRPC